MKEILEDKIIKKVENTHETFAYFDVSYNRISVKNPEDLHDYVNNFLNVLVTFHTANKLKLNKDKMTLLTVTMQRNQGAIRNLEIILVNQKSVKPQNQIKVLGFLKNQSVKNKAQVNKLI